MTVKTLIEVMALTEFLQKIADPTLEAFFRFFPQTAPNSEQFLNSKIIAHRGDTLQHVENTMDAFSYCLDNDIDGIEFDVRWTKDLEPVIHHDPHCGRIFKRPDIVISDISYSQLNSLFPMIPHLDEVLTFFAKKIHLMIELKPLTKSQAYQVSKIQEALASKLTHLSPGFDYHLLSLNVDHFEMAKFISKQSYMPIAQLNPTKIIQWSIDNNIHSLAAHYALLTPKMRLQLAEYNILYGTGFPDCINAYYREVKLGTRWIFTNHPHLLARSKQESLGRELGDFAF